MKPKKMFICSAVLFLLLASIISVVSAAEITNEDGKVHIKPSAAKGQEIVSGFKGAGMIADALDILTYLIYLLAIIDILVCTVIVLAGIYGKKVTSFKGIKDELEAREGIWKVSKAILYMTVGISIIDYIYYYV